MTKIPKIWSSKSILRDISPSIMQLQQHNSKSKEFLKILLYIYQYYSILYVLYFKYVISTLGIPNKKHDTQSVGPTFWLL